MRAGLAAQAAPRPNSPLTGQATAVAMRRLAAGLSTKR